MAAKFVSAAEAELACPVCYQFFVTPHEPKNLPTCSHILCQICLQKITEGGLKKIKCPQCNKISTLPKEGINGLTSILAMRNLAERHPEGIKQRKEYMQQEFHKEKEQAAERVIKLKEAVSRTQNAIEHEEKEIEKSVEAVMSKAQNLISQLRNTSGLVQLKQQLAKAEIQLETIEASQSKLETMTDDEFHVQTGALTNQIEKLKIDEAMEKIDKDPCVGKFIANVQLGRVVEPRRLELVQEFGEFELASGVDSNPSGVLVVCDYCSNSKQVTVFQNDNSQYKKQYQFSVVCTKEDASLDIAISNDYKCLLAKCTTGFDVCSLDGKNQKTASPIEPKSRQKFKALTCSITTTKDGRILTGSVIRAKYKESPPTPVATVHDTAGNLLKTIPTNIHPVGIADLGGTHVGVHNWVEDKVCVYDLQSGKETLNLDVPMPAGICYDEDLDCMLIGRFTKKDEGGRAVAGSGVIEQYCGITGKLVACLAKGLQCPYGMTVTGDNMLAVTDKTTVKIYNMH